MKDFIEQPIAGNPFRLFGMKYAFDIKNRSVIISDLHLGKASHFRKNGIPVPFDLAVENISRLEKIIQTSQPKEILILGDLFHSKMNLEWENFKALRFHFSQINFTLIEGNHDTFNAIEYQKANMNVYAFLERDAIIYSHEPVKSTIFNIHGHIHPAVRLKGAAKQSLRMPCFFISNNKMTLPAFGSFTGKHTLQVKSNDAVFGIVDDKIIDLKKPKKSNA
ncbi:MAG: ligase-associated DNA damage response endonuclease PdeM [Bacteroidota bacterium]